MPDGSQLRPLLPVWPELDCHKGKVDVLRFFAHASEAVAAYDASLYELEASRQVLQRAFEDLRLQALNSHSTAVQRVIHEALLMMLDIDADTFGWSLERQAAAEYAGQDD